VGGDINLTHGSVPDNTEAIFLDGVRIDNNIFRLGLRIEPVRDFIFDFIYEFNNEKNISKGTAFNLSYGEIKFTLNY
jgi:hypothetical protein